MTNPVHVGVDEDGVELGEGVPEELAHEVLLELEQEHGAVEEAREEETRRTERRTPRKLTEGLAEAFAHLSQLLKKFENMNPTPTGFR